MRERISRWLGLVPMLSRGSEKSGRSGIDLTRRMLTISAFIPTSGPTSSTQEFESLASEALLQEPNRFDIPANAAIDLTGKDVTIRNAVLSSTGAGAVVIVGGQVDKSAEILLKGNRIIAGSRSIEFERLTGVLGSDDWIYVSGHLEGAWTTSGGRVCELGYLCRIREVDLQNRFIHLYHSIAETIDSDIIYDGDGRRSAYTLAATKVIPRKVDVTGVELDRVTLKAQYVIDSNIDIRLTDAISNGFSVAVRVGNNLNIAVNSVARSASAGAHSLIVENIYGGKIDFQACAANYPPHTKTSKLIAKCFRGNGLIHCDVRSQVMAAPMWANTVHCMIGGRFVAYTSEPGTYNTDNNITSNNRSDANNFVYMRRGAQVDVTSVDFDATGLEIFGAHDSEIIGCRLSKVRAGNSSRDCGMLSIKGICRNLVVRNLSVVARGDANQAVRLEFHDVYRGVYQQGITFIDPLVSCDGHGLMTRGGYRLKPSEIKGASGLAKVVVPSHQMSTGMRIRVSGLSDAHYNGDFDIMVTDADEFTYSVPETARPDPGGEATVTLLMQSKISILGGRIKACRPVFTDRHINDITIDGATVEIELAPDASTGIRPGHAIVALGTGVKLHNLSIVGTEGKRYRAVSGEMGPISIWGGHSDGGIYFLSRAPDDFNPTQVQYSNMPIQIGSDGLTLFPDGDGVMSVDLSGFGKLAKLNVSSWPNNLFLRERGASRREQGWLLNDLKWVKVGAL